MNNFVRYALAFAAGAAVGIVIYRNSDEIRSVCTQALGKAMDLKDKAMEKAEIIKESAEDLFAESDAKRKKNEA